MTRMQARHIGAKTPVAILSAVRDGQQVGADVIVGVERLEPVQRHVRGVFPAGLWVSEAGRLESNWWQAGVLCFHARSESKAYANE